MDEQHGSINNLSIIILWSPYSTISLSSPFINIDERTILWRRSDGQEQRRSVRTPRFKERVLAQVEENASTSTRAVVFNIGTNHLNVWNVLHEQLLYSFRRRYVHGLNFEDYPRRLEFAR